MIDQSKIKYKHHEENVFPNKMKIGIQSPSFVRNEEQTQNERQTLLKVPANDEFSDSESVDTRQIDRSGLSLPSSQSQIFVPEFQGHGAWKHRASSPTTPYVIMKSNPTD